MKMLYYLTMTLIISVAVAILATIVIIEFNRNDGFKEGFECGFYSQLSKRAKQRYNKECDCVFFIVSKDDYDKEIDDIKGDMK